MQMETEMDGGVSGGGGETSGDPLLGPSQVIQSSSSWTLAGDAGLLKYLEKSSEDLLEKTGAVQQQLADVILEAKRTSTRFGNVNNSFLGLTNTQFIENRVYDEDVLRKSSSSEKAKLNVFEAGKTKGEREAEMVVCVRRAVEMGTSLLRTHFHKIHIRPQDFDEDDDPSFNPPPVFEPLDPYVNRALPFVIGTSDFQKWDHVGLVEDEEASNQSGVTGIDEEEDETIVVSMVGEEESGRPSAPSRPIDVVTPAPPNSDSSGMFGGDSGDSDDLFNEPPSRDTQPTIQPPVPTQPSTQDLLKSELSAKLGVKEKGPGEPPPQPQPSPRKHNVIVAKQEDSDDDDDLFGAPPRMPSSDAKSQSTITDTGLFQTRSGGLFQDDEDDIFGGPSLQSGGKGAAPSSVAPPVREEKKAERKVVPSQNKTLVSTGGLFGEEDSDEDDIFSIAVSKRKPPPKKSADEHKKVPEKSGNLFESDSEKESAAPLGKKSGTGTSLPKKESLFESDQDTETTPSKPPVFGGVGMFGAAGKSIAEEIQKKQKLSQASPPLSPPSPVKEKDAPRPSTHNTPTPKVGKQEPVSELFGSESEDEDLFATVIKKKPGKGDGPPPPPPPLHPGPQGKAATHTLSPDLFSDDGSGGDDIFGSTGLFPSVPAPSQRKKKAIFESDNEDSEIPKQMESGEWKLERPETVPKDESGDLKGTRDGVDGKSTRGLVSPKESSVEDGEAPGIPVTGGDSESLASLMIAGLKKNLEQQSNPLEPALTQQPPSSNVVASQEEDSRQSTNEISQDPFSDSFNPLPSLAKTRAKIPSKRRPPSRKPQLGESGTASSLTEAAESSRNIVQKAESPPESPPPMPHTPSAEEITSPSMDKIRVFDPLSASLEAEGEAGDSTPQAPPTAHPVEGKRENVARAPSQEKIGSLDSDDEDIFGDSLLERKPQGKVEPPKKQQQKIVDPLGLDDDDIDIFTESAPAQSRREPTLFHNSDSEEIFGAQPEVVKTPTLDKIPKGKEKANQASTSLFGEDEDSDLDIFK